MRLFAALGSLPVPVTYLLILALSSSPLFIFKFGKSFWKRRKAKASLEMVSRIESLQREIKKREAHFSYYASYVKPEIVKEIAMGLDPRLFVPIKAHRGILCCRINNFSEIENRLDPKARIAYLERFYAWLSNRVSIGPVEVELRAGNEILVFFMDASSTFEGAISLRKGLNEINQNLNADSQPSIRFSMGLSWGELIYGNVGSEEHLTRTFVGHQIKSAILCAWKAADFQLHVIASQDIVNTVRELTNHRWVGFLEDVDHKNASRIYEVFGHQSSMVADYKRETSNDSEAGLNFFFCGQYFQAMEIFSKLVLETPAEIKNRYPNEIGLFAETYLNRCRRSLEGLPLDEPVD